MNNLPKINLPIGVFDSGVGGLTVLRALRQQLPQESFLYLGDTARLPYGTKSPETVIYYAKQATQTLINRGIKLLVVACNTASALALSALHQIFPEVPMIGVLEPGAQAACSISKNGHIAVLATEATVKDGGYQMAIKKLRPDAKVMAQSCGLLVALAEEGWINGPIAEAITKRYLEPLLKNQQNYHPDCLVLGCTHFPALLGTIQAIVGNEIAVVDSAQTTAEIVTQTLSQLNLQQTNPHAGAIKFLVTDAPERFARVAKQFLNIELNLNDIELIDLSA